MPFVFQSDGGLLFKEASNQLISKLTSYGNLIDLPTRFALDALIFAFDQGLRGNLPQSYFLSSLDPGVGKTEAIAIFIKVWKSSGFIPKGSILIGLQNKEEIRSLIKRLDLDDADYAVLTRDSDLNNLGRGDGRQRQARVLITTQQMIASRTKDRYFGSAKDFFYEDNPRTLRLWDESFIVAQPVTIPLASIHGLIAPLKGWFSYLADELIAFLKPLVVEAAGELFTLSGRFKEAIGAALAEAVHGGGLDPSAKRTLESLQLVAGRSMLLLRHGGGIGKAVGASGLTLVGASRPIPKDFAPAIITDASGRVRGTYAAWEGAGGNLVRLPTKTNLYSKVTFKLWREKSGKDALADPEIGRLIFREVGRVIDGNIDKKWLVIGDKANPKIDVEAEVRASSNPKASIHYLNWGRHSGTNAYKDIRHIIVIGSHFYSAEAYKALGVAASGIVIDKLGLEETRELSPSEYQHNMLQAVMRGNARNSFSGMAGECTVYVLGSPRLDTAQLLRETFPGCIIEEWNPRRAKLSGQGRQLVECLTTRLIHDGERSVSKKSVRDILGIKHKQQLSTLLKGVLVRDALLHAGIGSDTNSFFVRQRVV